MGDTVLFDINETVLDLEPMASAFEAVFGQRWALTEWFGRLLHASTVCAITEVETDFRTLAEVGLHRSAALFSVELDAERRDRLLSGFQGLAAHPDVVPNLRRLRRAQMRCVAFSNSSSSLLQSQLEQSGLRTEFDGFLSVEELGSFKPDPAVYRGACERLDRGPDQVILVAAHDWDVHGALSAGLGGAYLARTPLPYTPTYLKPGIHGPSLDAVVDQLLV